MTTCIRRIVTITAVAVATTGVVAVQTPTFTRTELQDRDLTIKTHHAVMVRSEFQPGADSGRHFHPGEELGYLLEGTLELTVEGEAPRTIKAGDVIFVPAGKTHSAKNVGKTIARVLGTYVLEKGKPLATPVK